MGSSALPILPRTNSSRCLAALIALGLHLFRLSLHNLESPQGRPGAVLHPRSARAICANKWGTRDTGGALEHSCLSLRNGFKLRLTSCSFRRGSLPPSAREKRSLLSDLNTPATAAPEPPDFAVRSSQPVSRSSRAHRISPQRS